MSAPAGNRSFIGNFIWEIPKTSARGVLGQVANGWQVSGIYRYQSGQPYNLSVTIPGLNSTNILGTGNTAPPRVVVIGDPGSGHRSDPYRQFNQAAFTIRTPGSLGLESGRNFLTTAPTNNWDLSLSKSFFMGGVRKLEFRIDAFNAFNHTQFYGEHHAVRAQPGRPDSHELPYDSSGKLVNPNGFGAVNAVRPPRNIQLQVRFAF